MVKIAIRINYADGPVVVVLDVEVVLEVVLVLVVVEVVVEVVLEVVEEVEEVLLVEVLLVQVNADSNKNGSGILSTLLRYYYCCSTRCRTSTVKRYFV